MQFCLLNQREQKGNDEIGDPEQTKSNFLITSDRIFNKILEKLKSTKMFCVFMAIIHTSILIMNITQLVTICRRIYNGQRTCGCDELTEIENKKKEK